MNNVSDFVLFIGRFHPLIVHFPIGFLFFAFILELFSKWKNLPVLKEAIPLALLSGALSALVACILGYMLSLSGDYEENALDTHFWFGIATTIITFLAWLIRIGKVKIPNANTVKANISTLTLLVIVLSITGHYGGNLTHGSDYLLTYAPFQNNTKKELAAVEKVEDAEVYAHLVNPILQNKCASCHNPEKKKGGLSFENEETILKGGKTGAALIAGNATNSEMIKRVLLDPHEKKFMPPKGKTPLTDEEVAVITYWIDNVNANFTTKVAAVETPDTILDIAAVMLGLKASTAANGDTSLPTAKAIDDALLSEIKKEGFKIRELVFDSYLYEVILPSKTINNPSDLDQKLKKLLQIKDNIIWLSLQENGIADRHLEIVKQFNNLQQLKLNSNPITDKGVQILEENQTIQNINLYETKITKASLAAFAKMKNLEDVYVWKTAITKEDIAPYASKENYPNLILGM